MERIGFFDYPDKFAIQVLPSDLVSQHTPFERFYIRVQNDSLIKELWWDDELDVPGRNDVRANNLRELILLIQGTIQSKAEYRNLPIPSGGYS